jgi:hypothetical protein
VLDVTLSSPDGIVVLYQATEADPLVIDVPAARRRHRIRLARLRADAVYQVEVRRRSVERRMEPLTLSFRTDPLPADLAQLKFTTEGDLSAPLVLLEITSNQGGFEGLISVDEAGEVVWHHRLTAIAGATRRANGDFVVSSGSYGLFEIDPVDGVRDHLPQRPQNGERFHHDVIATPWNTLYALAIDTATVAGVHVAGEAIWEWNPERSTASKRWSSFDHLSYAEHQGWGTHPPDWLHANALWIGPSGNVTVSFAFLDQVISLLPDFSAVEWLLGGPNATIPTYGDVAFHTQHTAAEIPVENGRRVLLFDNGERSRGYSRALELEIDPQAGTARKVWEFRAPNNNWSPIVSLARRLENGNTFVAFGANEWIAQSHGPVEAYEVGPGADIRWHMEVSGYPNNQGFVAYRITPIGSLAGELVQH